MKILYSWLQEFCPTDLDPRELAERLTVQGVKVESVSRLWEGLSGVVVARVLEVVDHPSSDKLCLVRVDAGEGERRVVVGVRNMSDGDLVPYAPPGARVPALDEPLGERRLRGELSQGMLCSPWELAISPLHQGILILPGDTPVGADVKSHFGLDDVLFDIEVKSNRPDLLSVVGVAREAAAATGAPFTPPDTSVEKSGEKAEEVASVEIEDLDRCPRYVARVIQGVSVAPSPIGVQARLTASGMRPLWNVVDATNYVLLEMGHPLHPFDLKLLEGAAIVVRRAREGERIVTLDDVERRLTAEDLVIADRVKAVAVAGIMGSASAEVSPHTVDVLLESAHFERLGVRRTARRLNLQTEASARFGRGADPEAVDGAAARAARLMTQWSGGRVLAGSVAAGDVPARRVLAVRPARASLLLGERVSADDAAEAFERLGIRFSARDDALDVEVPSHRPDLEREADLIEEIARIRGYDEVGETLPGAKQVGGVPETYARRRRVREALIRAGLREIQSFSFGSQADLDLMRHTDPVMVANPLAAENAFLRTSLIPGLLRALGSNLARGAEGVALFEVGRVFRLADTVDEREMVAAALTGSASAGYPEPARVFDFFDAKGALEALMAMLEAPDWTLGDALTAPFHPGRSAHLVTGGGSAGVIAELHPREAEAAHLPPRVAVFEIDLAALPLEAGRFVAYREISRFPPVLRDLAFVVDATVPEGAVERSITEAAGELLTDLALFDVFAGGPIPAGKKSLAFSLDLRAPDRTLTDAEADATVQAIVERLRRDLGAELRSG